MDIVQFFQENNEFVENEHLFYEKSYDQIDMNLNTNISSNKRNNNSSSIYSAPIPKSTKANNGTKSVQSPSNSNNSANVSLKSPSNSKNKHNSPSSKAVPLKKETQEKDLNKLNTTESLFNSNSFTDYSSIDCDSLTDSSNKWPQSNNNNDNTENINKNKRDEEEDDYEAKHKSRYYSNHDYHYSRRPNANNNNLNDNKKNSNIIEEDYDIKEDLLINNKTNNDESEYRAVPRPKISRQKPLLAEILANEDNNDDDNDYEEIQIKNVRPDRPRTRRGRGQDLTTESRTSQNSDYVQLNECLSVAQKAVEQHNSSKQNIHEEIKEEIPDESPNNNNDKNEPKVIEVINFDESIDENRVELYTPPLPIEDEEPMTESEQSNKNCVEYITVNKLIQPNSGSNKNNQRNNNNINISKHLPKIAISQHSDSQGKNSKSLNEINRQHEINYAAHYSYNNKYHESPQSGRITNLSSYKLTIARNRDKYNVSRSTCKSNDSRGTYGTVVSLHSRKMNQDEILQSVNRLYYVPKRNFEHPKFKTLHDKYSNVDIDAVSLRLFSSKSHRNKDMQQNQKPVKYLNKVEIDKLIDRLVSNKSNSRVPESCRVIQKSEYKNMGVVASFAWQGYN